MAKTNSTHKKDKKLKSLNTDPLKTSEKSLIKNGSAAKKPVTSLKNIQSQLNDLILQREDEIKLIADLKQQLQVTKKQVNSGAAQLDHFVEKKDLKKLKNKLKETSIEFHKNTQTLSQEILIFKSLTQRIKSKIKLLEQDITKNQLTPQDENHAVLLEKINQFELQLKQFDKPENHLNQELYEKIIAQTDSNIKSSLAEQTAKIQSGFDTKYEKINKDLNEQIQVLLAEQLSVLEDNQQTKLIPLIEKHHQHDTKLSNALSQLEELNSKHEKLAGNNTLISANLSSLTQELKQKQDSQKIELNSFDDIKKSQQQDIENNQHKFDLHQHEIESHQHDLKNLQLDIDSLQHDIENHQRNTNSRQNDIENYQRDMETHQGELENHQHETEIHQASNLNQLKNKLTTRSQLFLVGMLGICILSIIIIVKNNTNHQLEQASLITQFKKEFKQDTQSQLSSLSQQNSKIVNLQLKQLEDSIQQIKYETKRDTLTTQSQQEIIQKTISELSTKLNSLSDAVLISKSQNTSPQESIENKPVVLTTEPNKDIVIAPQTPPQNTLAPPTGKALTPPYYGIQLLGARKQNTIENFIKKHQLSEQVKIHQRSFDGKPWFILVYGQYANAKEALKDLKQLPDILQVNKPWVKKIP